MLFVSLDVQKNFNIEKHERHECLRQYIFCHTEITENTGKRFLRFDFNVGLQFRVTFNRIKVTLILHSSFFTLHFAAGNISVLSVWLKTPPTKVNIMSRRNKGNKGKRQHDAAYKFLWFLFFFYFCGTLKNNISVISVLSVWHYINVTGTFT